MNLPPQSAADASADVAIVKRVQAGDVNAYNLLVIRYQHRVRQVIARLTGDSPDTGDIAQEAFLKAYRAIGSFRGDSSFYTWLYRIVINAVKSHLESNRRSRGFVDIEEAGIENSAALSTADTPDRILESDELKDVIAQALSGLPAELRQALVLREVEEMSYDDIAAMMKTSVGTVKSRIFRARQQVEAALRSHGGPVRRQSR